MKLGSYLLGPNDAPENGIYEGDCRELARAIPDESVDLIFTDPPYLREHLPLYGWLAGLAARTLKPTGFLLVYVGVYWKDVVLSSLCKELDYYLDLILVNAGRSPIFWRRHAISRYKSIIALRPKDSNGEPRCNVLTLWKGGGEDKRYHVWGQDESSARYYIDCFSRSGDVVLDPLLGGGTTAAMCRVLGRRYLAFEIDPATCELARERVRNTQPPLFVAEAEQLAMAMMPAGGEHG